MYRSAAEVWKGLAKNATEGLAAPARILPFSFLLFFGQIAPLLLAAALLVVPALANRWIVFWVAASVAASFLPRLVAVARFRQKAVGAWLHPIGIAVLLALQWYAFGRKLAGQPATWKQRAYTAG
jgi:hypothetical protein